MQSVLNYTKLQESASRAVLGGTGYPLYYENGGRLRENISGFVAAKGGTHPPRTQFWPEKVKGLLL